MKTVIGAISGAAIVLAFLSVVVQQLEPSQAEARSCYSIWAQADPMDSSTYRHTVYVENDCEKWLQCTVWTDVNPQPPKMISVGARMTEKAETNGRSEYDDPRAFGSCRFK